MKGARQFQRWVQRKRFRAWLGSTLEVKVQIVARGLDYSDTPWRDRPPEELARAFREREVLIDPRKELGIAQGEE